MRELGQGGMATVYLAEDLKHRRQVAIKVLKPELAAAIGAERFLREIETTASLRHPNILPLYDSGEADGLLYYIMPFVEGESLRDRLDREKQLPLDDALQIAREVGDALGYAHSRGVVHRDIKPENILLESGHAQVADFGIAKAISAASGGTLTQTGVGIGTPQYMSPEQATASQDIDGRSDLYSLGCVLYEMLAGDPPYTGPTAQAILARRFTDPVPSLRAVREMAPPAVEAAIMRALARAPADRFRTVSGFIEAIGRADSKGPGPLAATAVGAHAARARRMRVAAGFAGLALGFLALGVWWRTRAKASGDGEIRSIAVLPFENTSGDTTFDYLEDGITDQVRDALNAIPQLTVKARSSSRQLKGHDVREVGTKLGVGAVIQGTVSRSSSRLHVAAELVRVSDGNALWSGTFEGQPGELIGIQDTIVRAITDKLRPGRTDLSTDRHPPRAARGTTDIEAYDLFLRGRHAYDQVDFAAAGGLFRDAIARDPRFARAHGYLAMTYANAPVLGLVSVNSMNGLARVSAQRALALDSTVAEAYVAESFILTNDMRFAEAVSPLEKAYLIDSSNVDVVTPYGLGLAQIGRVEEGLQQLRRARDQDPLSGSALGVLSYLLFMSRQYDAAIAEGKAALDLDPKNILMLQALGFYFAFHGMPDSAVAAFETAFRLNPAIFNGRSNLVFGYAAAGRWNDAAQQRALVDREAGGNSPNYHRMIGDLAFGEYDAAMTALERAIAAREPLLGLSSIPCDPLYDPLKSDPRFATLMQRIGARACPARGKWPIELRH
ncbi:MAG: protein kinase [Gemmatimonadota bacterium]